MTQKLSELQLDTRDSKLQDCVVQLYKELAARGLEFKPHVWVSTEFFAPGGVPGFAVPFYLLSKALQRLEKFHMGFVEGGTKAELMKLLRHEAGHAIDNAYGLRKSKLRQKLFGLTGQAYPKSYRPNKRSTDFVFHLDDLYAQAHPDEDWAETFAVWLNPKSNWRKDYAGTKAHQKLELLEALMIEISGKKPLITNQQTPEHFSSCQETLQSYFETKQKRYSPRTSAEFPI